jgi:hypothetical protein
MYIGYYILGWFCLNWRLILLYDSYVIVHYKTVQRSVTITIYKSSMKKIKYVYGNCIATKIPFIKKLIIDDIEYTTI